jgi:hypothetical protein
MNPIPVAGSSSGSSSGLEDVAAQPCDTSQGLSARNTEHQSQLTPEPFDDPLYAGTMARVSGASPTPKYAVSVSHEANNFIEFACRADTGWSFRLHVVRATGAAYVKTRTGKHASARVAAKRMSELSTAVAEFIAAQGITSAVPVAAIAKATRSAS